MALELTVHRRWCWWPGLLIAAAFNLAGRPFPRRLVRAMVRVEVRPVR